MSNVPFVMNKSKLCPANTFTVLEAAYTALDVVGGLITIPVPSAGSGGVITDIYLRDAANQNAAYTLFIYREAPTAIADGDTFSSGTTIADQLKLLHVVNLLAAHYTDIITTGAVTIGWAHIPDLSLKYDTLDGNLYMYMRAVATPDYALVTDLSAAYFCWLD